MTSSHSKCRTEYWTTNKCNWYTPVVCFVDNFIVFFRSPLFLIFSISIETDTVEKLKNIDNQYWQRYVISTVTYMYWMSRQNITTHSIWASGDVFGIDYTLLLHWKFNQSHKSLLTEIFWVSHVFDRGSTLTLRPNSLFILFCKFIVYFLDWDCRQDYFLLEAVH